jgi:hypothetical protein
LVKFHSPRIIGRNSVDLFIPRLGEHILLKFGPISRQA